MMKPSMPSKMISSPSLKKSNALDAPTTAGMPKIRAIIALCEVFPPISVMNPRTLEESI